MLLTCAEDLANLMGWEDAVVVNPKKQREIFPELTATEEIIVNILREKAPMHIDELHTRCALSSSAIAAAMLNLEIQQVVQSLPGKMFRLIP